MLVTRLGKKTQASAICEAAEQHSRTCFGAVMQPIKVFATAICTIALTSVAIHAGANDDVKSAIPRTQQNWQGMLNVNDSTSRSTRTSILNLRHKAASVSGDSLHSEMSIQQLADDDIFDSRAGAEYLMTNFSLTQRVGDGFAHFGSEISDNEYSVNGGFSIGRALFLLGASSGDSATQLDAGGFGFVDPFFFHGGDYQRFRSRSAAIAFDLGDSLTTHASHLTIASPGMQQRSTSTFGLSSDSWHSHALYIQRDNVYVGDGLDLGFSIGPVDTQLQALRTQTNAYTARLSFGYLNKADKILQFHVQQDKNPLFDDGEDTRFMLSIGGLLGAKSTNLFKANETEATTEEDEARRRNRKTLMIAGIAVGAAAGVALSSSSSVSDAIDGNEFNNRRFPDEAGAARGILSNVNPTSVAEDREYGGWVFRRRDGTFSFTTPNIGTNSSVRLGNIRDVPSGARTTASYHSHGGPDRAFDKENFSPQDKFVSDANSVNGYLSTPSGLFKFYNWRTGVDRIIGRVPN